MKKTNLKKILLTVLFIFISLFLYLSNVSDLYFHEDIVNFENKIKPFKLLLYIVTPLIYFIILLLIDYKEFLKKMNFIFYLIVFIVLFFLSYKSILNGCLILNKEFKSGEETERIHYYKILNEKLLLYDQYSYLKESNFPENIDRIQIEKSVSCTVRFDIGYFGIPFNGQCIKVNPKVSKKM